MTSPLTQYEEMRTYRGSGSTRQLGHIIPLRHISLAITAGLKLRQVSASRKKRVNERFSFNRTHLVLYSTTRRRRVGRKIKTGLEQKRISLNKAALHLARSSSGLARNAISLRRVSVAVLGTTALREWATPLT